MRVDLAPAATGTAWAVLRPFAGHDELALDPADPAAGSTLLGRLLQSLHGAAAGRAGLGALSVADRDRLLAALFAAWFGNAVELLAACRDCGEGFALAFDLEALRTSQTMPDARLEGPDEQGFFVLDRRLRFRPPTLDDVEAVTHLPEDVAVDALLQRCVDGLAAGDAALVQEAMAQVAPVLALDIATRCPHCAAAQDVPFSLEAHLLGLLAQERPFLTHEIHLLARAYGWSLGEILQLSRDDRRTLVRLCEAEQASAPPW
jgi:hypothetical protein